MWKRRLLFTARRKRSYSSVVHSQGEQFGLSDGHGAETQRPDTFFLGTCV